MSRGRSSSGGGMPIEEAPLWVLAIATPLIGSVLFLGAVGFQDAIGLWHGQWRATALGALAAAAVLLGALARQKPWRRPRPGEPDTRPRLVRFASWLLGTAAFAFVLQGVLALIWGKNHPGPNGVAYVMAVIAAARALLEGIERLNQRIRERTGHRTRE